MSKLQYQKRESRQGGCGSAWGNPCGGCLIPSMTNRPASLSGLPFAPVNALHYLSGSSRRPGLAATERFAHGYCHPSRSESRFSTGQSQRWFLGHHNRTPLRVFDSGSRSRRDVPQSGLLREGQRGSHLRTLPSSRLPVCWPVEGGCVMLRKRLTFKLKQPSKKPAKQPPRKDGPQPRHRSGSGFCSCSRSS